LQALIYNNLYVFSLKYKKMFRIFSLVLTLLFTPVLCAEPFWGNKGSLPFDTDTKKLKAGQFIWQDNAVSSGAVVALVSIPEQRIYLYRNGILIAVSTVSTGKRGYGTPAGIFTVLEKDRYHRSRTYDNAPMPYANRLTWEGVALHAGHVTGAPASHGCIRLPTQFARSLFGISTLGMTVVITGYQGQSFKLSLPTTLSPVASMEGKFVNLPDLTPDEQFRWQPENAPEGSVSIVMSEKDQYLLVYRNGVEIGRAKISMTLAEKNLGTHAFIMQEGIGTEANLFLPTAPAHQWMAIGSSDHDSEKTIPLNTAFFEHLDIPMEFATAMDSVLSSGTTLLITDNAMLRHQPIRNPAKVRCIRGNCIDGRGTQVYADGSKYVGQFKNGVSEGEGELILSSGEKYVGKFKNDKFQWD
jgi:hypothetical protein